MKQENLRTMITRFDERIKYIFEATSRIEGGLEKHIEEDRKDFKALEGKMDRFMPYMIILSGVSIAMGWVAKGLIGG